jgi:hypothetical protein
VRERRAPVPILRGVNAAYHHVWHENPAYANANPLQWSITVGAVPGRLEIAHLANGGIWNSRGLEIIKRVGDRYWLLQNFSDTPSSLPPVYTPATSFLAWDKL